MSDPATNVFPLSSMLKRPIIDQAIHNERDFQDSKFPEANPSVTGCPEVEPTAKEEQALLLGSVFGTLCRELLESWPKNTGVTNLKRLAILGEEMGEVCDALLDADSLEMGRELLQVVAVGYAWLEALPVDEIGALCGFRQEEEREDGSKHVS